MWRSARMALCLFLAACTRTDDVPVQAAQSLKRGDTIDTPVKPATMDELGA